jgi:hypothetical protein
VEADGYEINGWVGATSAKSKIRSARDSQGRKLDTGRVTVRCDAGRLPDRVPDAWPVGDVVWFAAAVRRDFTQFVVGVRQDITYKILDQAVIQDNTGAIVYNLPQQDMTAIRLTFRVGWQVANTINNDQPTEASRYPVASLLIP